jgi:hypothetical protein
VTINASTTLAAIPRREADYRCASSWYRSDRRIVDGEKQVIEIVDQPLAFRVAKLGVGL